jgi:hypothetical protein
MGGGNIISEKIFKRKVMRKVVFGTVMMFGLSVFANAEWVTPKGIDKESLEDANLICKSKGGVVPSENHFRKVIQECGGVVNEGDNNKANLAYQSCYKKKGFSSDKYYWTSSPSGYIGVYDAKTVNLEEGTFYDIWSGDKSRSVRCIKY